MGYTKTAVKGISWVLGLNLSAKLVSFLRTIFLARLLTPAEFGIYGIGLLVLSLLETLTETGVNIFLVQQKEDLKKWIDSAWIVSIGRGISIFLFMLFSSSLIAKFFRSENAVHILLLFSLVPLVRGFINPSVVKFQKELNFGKEFAFRIAIIMTDTIIAITLAFYTHMVISLVIGVLSGAILELILSFMLIEPKPTFKINKDYIKKVFYHGKWITLSGIFNYLYSNLDNIVVGRLLGVSSLGLYEMAYNISRIPITGVSDVISKVTFPVYTLIAEDKKRLKRAFIRSTLLVCFIIIPFGAIIFLYPHQIVKIVLGDKWIGIADTLKILIIFGVVRGISGFSSSLFLSVKKQKYLTIITFISLVSLLLTIYPLVKTYGIMGAAISALIGALISLPLFIYYILKILK